MGSMGWYWMVFYICWRLAREACHFGGDAGAYLVLFGTLWWGAGLPRVGLWAQSAELQDSGSLLSCRLWGERAKVAKALDWIAPMWPFSSCVSCPSPCFTEELREMKWVKRCLVHCWRSMRNKLDQAQVRAAIKAYFMVIRAEKHQYFSILILCTESWPVALLRVTRALLGRRDSEVHLQGWVKEFAEHLSDKISQICSQFSTSLGRGPVEMPRV